MEYRDFNKGYALFVFDLTPSILDGDQVELIRSGSVRLELKFADALSSPIHVMSTNTHRFHIMMGQEIVTVLQNDPVAKYVFRDQLLGFGDAIILGNVIILCARCRYGEMKVLQFIKKDDEVGQPNRIKVQLNVRRQ
ncbi:hypothetical protein PoB_001064600 [Plakobranchus ocellatus]|uniref:Uncharacterized protein n=1 Tax=Plakobranchus ocellatus TaxID=259542 RepID=A0AAV3YA55_9GAST|nr:hypothetical protein PoB_001064600 [Plakobranchus ocellatus]